MAKGAYLAVFNNKNSILEEFLGVFVVTGIIKNMENRSPISLFAADFAAHGCEYVRSNVKRSRLPSAWYRLGKVCSFNEISYPLAWAFASLAPLKGPRCRNKLATAAIAAKAMNQCIAT